MLGFGNGRAGMGNYQSLPTYKSGIYPDRITTMMENNNNGNNSSNSNHSSKNKYKLVET